MGSSFAWGMRKRELTGCEELRVKKERGWVGVGWWDVICFRTDRAIPLPLQYFGTRVWNLVLVAFPGSKLNWAEDQMANVKYDA